MGIPELYGYRISVFSWIARWTLAEKGVAYRWVEVNPFAEDVPPAYLALNPFCRVPTLVDDGFTLYETGAITEYIDDAFDGPPLMPATPADRARVRQFIALVAGEAYWPLVRQVFVHGSSRATTDEPPDEGELAVGLQRSGAILAALERLAGDGPFLVGERLTLADLHLAPMISYFCEAPAGARLLGACPALSRWSAQICERALYQKTRPDLSVPAE